MVVHANFRHDILLTLNPSSFITVAFFPRFPFDTTDNQYHLQALRHLYALAVKKRELRFVDVDSGKNVQIPVEVSTRCGDLLYSRFQFELFLTGI